MEAVMERGVYLDTNHGVVLDIMAERDRQDEKWGPAPESFLTRPDGTGGYQMELAARAAKRQTDEYAKQGLLTWSLILWEEVREAMAETDPAKLREELIQVAAVATAWAETIDARRRS